jgi:hypothetical protein
MNFGLRHVNANVVPYIRLCVVPLFPELRHVNANVVPYIRPCVVPLFPGLKHVNANVVPFHTALCSPPVVTHMPQRKVLED